ncbi:Unc104-like kinesin, putative [Leishmania donovani]|uniref:Unc104-like kinesin, putative n=1 Tax=Leishmania donovani TaxID=5661 RepID=E9BRK7_LEIDO|nr:Unc104-like kinesin, putative [Leishmania donovani]CBZ37886.1 Unc104-like kinesin, putative [Leishmania donovani]
MSLFLSSRSLDDCLTPHPSLCSPSRCSFHASRSTCNQLTRTAHTHTHTHTHTYTRKRTHARFILAGLPRRTSVGHVRQGRRAVSPDERA